MVGSGVKEPDSPSLESIMKASCLSNEVVRIHDRFN